MERLRRAEGLSHRDGLTRRQDIREHDRGPRIGERRVRRRPYGSAWRAHLPVWYARFAPRRGLGRLSPRVRGRFAQRIERTIWGTGQRGGADDPLCAPQVVGGAATAWLKKSSPIPPRKPLDGAVAWGRGSSPPSWSCSAANSAPAKPL